MKSKVEIYNKISEIPNVTVYQQRPKVLEVFPCITFNFESNVPTYTLDKDHGRENATVKIDIWTKSSVDASNILVFLEAKMLELDYILTFNTDILDPSGIFHITTQFKF